MSATRLLGGAWWRIKEFSALAADATYLVPRWIVLRAVGIIYAFVFTGIISEAPALIGPHGLVPLAGFFSEWAKTHPNFIEAFLRAPSLFWLNASPGMIATLAWGGLAASIALVLNLWPRMALFVCWLFFLSFVTTWRGFSASQVDQLMLETALLCIPFAPAGLRPGLGTTSPPRPIAVFMMRWLLFRVMFESGLVKIFAGDPHWLNFTALDVLYETTPFPTILAYFDHQMPHAYHVGEIALTFAAEIAAPLMAVFAGRRGRWLAFAIWTVFQLGIQLTNNFGWLNAASAGLGFLLLDDQMISAAAAKLKLRKLGHFLTSLAIGHTVPPAPPWIRYGLRAALGTHFCLTLYFFALNCGLPVDGFPYAVIRPMKFLFWDFRSANAYTLYAGLLPARIGVEFEGSNDGGATWRPYDFRYQPQKVDEISPFIAPRYARFEATLQVESNRRDPSPLFGLVAGNLLSRNPDVMRLFRHDPFPDRAPTMVRIPVYHLTFTDLATRRKTGHFWHKELSGYYQPMMYRDDQGRIAEATSALDEVRLKAEQGLVDAQARLGYVYAYGDGVPKDIKEAANWFRKAAEQGDAQSQFFIGLCYANGDGVTQNYAEAAKFYRLAAMQGNALAQTNLGFLYARGQGFARDEVEALAWFNVAARSGNRDAVKILETQASRAGAERATLARKRSEALIAEIEARNRSR